MSKRAVYICAKCGSQVPAKRWMKHHERCVNVRHAGTNRRREGCT